MRPDHFAGGGGQCHHLALETAALVVDVSRRNHFQGGNGHQQLLFGQRRGAGDGGAGVVVHLDGPEQFPGQCVDGIGAGQDVAEERRGRVGFVLGILQDDGRAHLRRSLKGPALATGLQVEGVHDAVLAADEDGAHGDGGLRPGSQCVRKGEGPLELEVRHVRGVESRQAGVDEAAGVVAPADLGHRARAVERRRFARAGGCPGGDRLGVKARAGDVLGDVRSLLVAEVGGLRLHDSVRHGSVNRLGGHHLQKGQVRRLAHSAFVAKSAVLRVQRCTGHLLPRSEILTGRLELVS